MNVIIPTQITASDVVTYNVPQETPLWNVATSYSKGTVVTKDDCGAVRYESLINNNVGNDPSTDDGMSWLRLDTPSNCYAMFDESVGTQTIGDLTIDDGDIKIKINTGAKLSAFAFLNVTGVQEVYVKVLKSDGVTIAYETTRPMRQKNASGWWNWLFGGFRLLPSFIQFGFPPVRNGTIEVEFRSLDGAVAKVGSLQYGDLFEIGQTTYGVSMELKDFSRFEEDDFGNYTIVPRRKSKRPSYPVLIEPARFDDVFRRLESLGNRPVLWIPDKEKFGELAVLGFYRDLRMDFSTPAWVNTTLVITGTPN
jgi:hypothetical protein